VKFNILLFLIVCNSWILKVVMLFGARCKHEDLRISYISRTVISHGQLYLTDSYISRTVISHGQVYLTDSYISRTVISHGQLYLTDSYISRTVISHGQLYLTDSYISRTFISHGQLYLTDNVPCVISDFRREVDENSSLLGYYAVSSGNSLLTFWGLLTLEDGTDRLSRNVGKELPLLAAS
jgi:predicted GNAT family N-acyltransferase